MAGKAAGTHWASGVADMTLSEPVNRLMAEMTLAEKIGQLNLLAAGQGLTTGAAQPTQLARRLDDGQVGAVFGIKSRDTAREMQARALAGSRLRIPLFFAEDVIHGHRTVFPLPVALACSWDLDLIEETAAFAAAEAFAQGIHQVLAPMIDICRDPRWGRVAESPGEDPLLGSRYTAAMVRGFQGPDIAAPSRVAACLKHFVAYGAPDSGRDYDNASLAWEDLLTIYLPPFEAGVASRAASVMAGFNAVNKRPMHAHAPLIEGWLRARHGFDGLMISDYTGVKELSAHGIGPPPVVVAQALFAGIDMDMVGEDYLRYLPDLAETGLDAPDADVALSARDIRELIDRACHRVLTFKARLGLLSDPTRGLGDRPGPARGVGRALARRAATRSVVLLKNDRLLPLAKERRIALIGPFGRDQRNMLGTWAVSGRSEDVIPLHRAIADTTGTPPDTAWGANIVEERWLADRLNVHGETVMLDPRDEATLLTEAQTLARGADVVVATIGEAKEHAGESSSTLAPEIPALHHRLIKALRETGTPLVVIVFAGRPLALGTVPDQADALLYAWHGGIAGPQGVADLLFGDSVPSGRLSVTLPAHPGETPLSYAEEPTGRPAAPGRFQKFRTGWLDLSDDQSRFPFGFGLGFGTVDYGAPALSATEAAAGEAIRLRLTLENRSDDRAIETVQLYASDPVARITRPGRFLIDFKQVTLEPGERRQIGFELRADQFAYPVAPSLETATWGHDPGLIRLHVGPNSRDTQDIALTWTS
ncbi:MAG: glycoside hydrolase family 3 N-terminal domain-containing protein [Pseudomonadota bacterium]